MKITKTLVAIAAALALTAAGAATANVLTEEEPVLAASGEWQLLKSAEGTLIYNPFDKAIPSREVQDIYEFNGDTDPELAFVRSTDSGLQVGVEPMPGIDSHNGYFAVTHDAYPESSVFHVRMSKQPGQIESAQQVGQAVFAVQTASTKITGLINFIVLSADSTAGTTSWRVGYMHGLVKDAQYVHYWSSPASVDAPDTQEITLRTDGRRTLTVWFGAEQVFHSDQLQLHIQAPYQPYLEVQAVKTPYMSSFQNFWVVKDDHLQLTGLPGGSAVKLIDGSGATLAEAVATQAGNTTLELPPYLAKGRGTLEISQQGQEPVRLGAFDYAGGDELRVVRQ